jgi:hypothetical protein
MARGQGRFRPIGLNAAAPPAVARRPRRIEHDMADLARASAHAAMDRPIGQEVRAHPGAHRQGEEIVMRLPR